MHTAFLEPTSEIQNMMEASIKHLNTELGSSFLSLRADTLLMTKCYNPPTQLLGKIGDCFAKDIFSSSKYSAVIYFFKVNTDFREKHWDLHEGPSDSDTCMLATHPISL